MLPETTSLWVKSIGRAAKAARRPSNLHAIERLRTSLGQLRERAALIAAEIPRIYPMLTDHSVAHSEALWEVASEVSGSAYPMTPAEAYVFGSAVLIHDLGIALAGYPGGEAELRKSVEWRDAVSLYLRASAREPPSQDEISSVSEGIALDAVRDVLRARHAEHATDLVRRSWRDIGGTEFRLIEDSELRDYYGRVIGLIAASHGRETEELTAVIRPEVLNPLPWMPGSWTVDAVKVAVLLRVADAAHISAARAPSFQAAIRGVPKSSASASHWSFQARLGKVVLQGDGLVVSAGGGFPVEEASAWWLCYDTIRMIDRELRDVDRLLRETNRPRLAARFMVGAEHPRSLARYVPTVEWQPVDARIHVSDLPALVKSLGGESLYGSDPRIPLRELIQNAADAVQARRCIERRGPSWGRVGVATGSDERGPWIEVSDTGVGMSESVLTGHLLDFGKSLWSSPAVASEFPGLASSNFSSAGRYGIGFFSVFMWGEMVQVRSRRFDADQTRTRVLEFTEGLGSRPIIRDASIDERPLDGGTAVRVWFRSLQIPDPLGGQALPRTLAALAPALEVDLVVEGDGHPDPLVVVAAGDWTTVPGSVLLGRLGVPSKEAAELSHWLDIVAGPDGKPLGRLAISPFSDGMVISRGLSVAEIEGVSGVIHGTVEKVARNFATPAWPLSTMPGWATRQAEVIAEHASRRVQAGCSAAVSAAGGDVACLALAKHEGSWLTLSEIVGLAEDEHEIVLLEDEIPERFEDDFDFRGPTLMLEGRRSPISVGERYRNPSWQLEDTIPQTILTALAQGWGTTVDAVEDISEMNERQKIEDGVIDEYIRFHRIRRPG